MIVDTYPLSPMQQGMLFHTLLDPGSGVDVQQLVVDLCEPLCVSDFRQAWARVLERHPILRTDFRWTHVEEPLQQVHGALELPWREEDWREFAPVDREERFSRFLSADRRRGLDMARAPLFRLTLFHFSSRESRFVWTVHHALLDGRSITSVMREVFVLYRAFGRGEDANVPTPRPFRDYIDWLQTQEFAGTEAFWRQTLNALPARTSLLAEDVATTEPAADARRGGCEAILPPDVTVALRRLAQDNAFTLNTLVKGAWAVLLSRYSDQSDVIFGVVRACRSALAGAEAMVGPFSNTLPLRTRVDPDAELVPWLQGLHAQWRDMRSYEHTPLGKLRAWCEGAPGSPLFDSIVMFENFQLDSALQPFGEPGWTRKFMLLGQSIYPINLLAYDGVELRLAITSGGSRANETALGEMLRHLRTLLEEIATNPRRTIAELPLMTATERNQLLRDWNETTTSYSAGTCLHELFERQVDATPEAVALIFDDARLTYGELNDRANRLARHLRKMGIGTSDLVAVFMERSIDLGIALLGVLKAGAAYVPIDPSYPPARTAFMLSDAKASIVLSQKQLAGSLPAGLRIICLDDPEWITRTDTTPNPSRIVTDANLAYVIYTSGSTGQPKGVMISHRAIVNNILWMRSTFPMDAQDRVLQKTEFSFDPSVWEFFLPLSVGAQLVIPRASISRDPDALLELIIAHRITILNCIPSFLQMLMEIPKFTAYRALRHCFCGGEVMSAELARRFYASQTAQLHNMYGPTEVTITSLAYSVPRYGFSDPIPIGRPVANTQAYVLNRHGELVPIGIIGELYLGGQQLAEGYYNRPELTAGRFLRPRGLSPGNTSLFRTGDRVRLRPDRNIEFLGRVDDQIKLRGYRIELGEVEAALRGNAKVRDCAALLHRAGTGQEQLIAYVSPRSSEPDLIAEIRNHLKAKLPAYMIPDTFVVLDVLPTTPNGKVDRQALPKPEQRDRSARHYSPPRTPTEAKLASIWSNILDCQTIGIYDNFFEIGGDSLAAVRLVSAINRALDVDIGVSDLFAMPTIAQLAGAVSAHPSTRQALPTVVRLHEGTRDPPIYFIGSALFRLARLVGGQHSTFGIDGPWRDALKVMQPSASPKLEQLVAPCVSALVAHMRSPRCILVGYSLEGLMAFEIAHQLHKRAAKVELVILLDTSTKQPNAYRALWNKWQKEWNNRTTASQFFQRFIAAAARRVAFEDASPISRCANGDLPWHITDKLLMQLQSSYQLQPIESRGVFFQAQAADSLGPLQWRELFVRGLEILQVPGDHFSMLQSEQHLQKLASEMRNVLERELEVAT